MNKYQTLIGATLFSTLSAVNATVINTVIDGSDAIWLAGRTDLAIPDASAPWPGGLIRHGGATPEEIKETLPPGFSAATGDIIRVLDPADGGISFFNGFGGSIFGPDGNGVPGSSSISSFGGISGYLGTQGALVGLFLDSSIPNGVAPSRLDFSLAGLGVEFSSLSPELNQVFFIGDGVTSTNLFQTFVAPTGTTRLFVGITDAFGFNGAPGAFDDNDGSYRIKIGINEIPTTSSVPEAPLIWLISCGLLGILAIRKKSSSACVLTA